MEFFKPLKLFSTLNRKKEDPSKFTFTGVISDDNIDIQLFEFTKEECVEVKKIPPLEVPVFKESSYKNWLNIYGLNDTSSIVLICEKQGIDSLVIQDILDVNQRPKFQEFEEFSFLTLKSIVPTQNELITEQISFIFDANLLISFQERKADFFEHLRLRLRENKGILRQRNADYLLYAMLESILDNYFKTLSKLGDDVQQYNLTDTKNDPSLDVLADIENNKKIVLFIKKSILPIKEFTQVVERGECKCIESINVKYFLEIKDLCLTLIDNSDMILSSLESATNLFFSVQGHRMNQVMKTLTVVATIFIPLTFIVGIYGMNFINMPELEWKYSYAIIWGIMLLVFFGMLFYFKRKKWF